MLNNNSNSGSATPPLAASYAASLGSHSNTGSSSSSLYSRSPNSRSHTPDISGSVGASVGAGANSASSSSSWLPQLSSSPQDFRRTPTPLSSSLHQQRPGYARHEIEGIGGVVKTKLVRIVRVGACVPEWEDERHSGQVLGREVSGRARSWCGWCWRAIPGKKDFESCKKGGAVVVNNGIRGGDVGDGRDKGKGKDKDQERGRREGEREGEREGGRENDPWGLLPVR